MSPVNAKDSEGLPVFYIKNIPAVSDVGLKVAQPAIYFGEEPDSYAIVKAATPEFDYPKGADNVYSYYKGIGGVPVSGPFAPPAVQLLLPRHQSAGHREYHGKSRIMIRRNIRTASYIAPFLNQDRDPYVVLQRPMVWIVDCYTTSDHFPYSQRNSDGINYIRNSVKVVVDAYTGARIFTSPIPRSDHQTWRDLPGDVQADVGDAAGFAAHIRYPEDSF